MADAGVKGGGGRGNTGCRQRGLKSIPGQREEDKMDVHDGGRAKREEEGSFVKDAYYRTCRQK